MTASAKITFPGETSDFHGYLCHDFMIDNCQVHVVEPKTALASHPWIWRTMFWGGLPETDLALLALGYHFAFIDVGNTFGCPDALAHFDAFYAEMTETYGLSLKPVLEGISRGGLYAYRWASQNPDKVGCIYGDAPVCDMKSWPGGKGHGDGSPDDWQLAIQCYHFANEQEMMDYSGNPIDTLAPLATQRVPLIHVTGDADTAVPQDENTDILRARYLQLGGDFVLIAKQGCGHHPHGLTKPTALVDFIVAHTAGDDLGRDAMTRAPKSGSVILLSQESW